jgi:hypothetical protein
VDVNDGRWHRFTLLYRPNTSEGPPSSRDGIVKAWVDGYKQIHLQQSVVGVTPAGGTAPWSTQQAVDAISDDGVSFLRLPSLFNCSRTRGWVVVEPPRVWRQ